MARNRTPAAPAVEVTAIKLGARGDGIATHDGQTLFVAGLLPGETALIRPGAPRGNGSEAVLIERRNDAPERRQPPCAHFGSCGGCAVQHLDDAPYRAWKLALLIDALARRGLGHVLVAPVETAPPGARRRARFALEAGRDGLRPAFRAARSHDLVAPAACPVLDEALLPAARALAAALAAKGVEELEVTLTASGLDAMVIARRAPSPDESFDLAAVAKTADLARIAWREAGRPPYALAERRSPHLVAGAVTIDLPPGAFVQPTAWGEAAIVAHLAALLPAGVHLADLYAGCGVLGLALGADRRVDAFEAAPAMVTAANRAAAGARRRDYRAETRDLEAAPLESAELARFAAVVLDPPRGGARTQCQRLATADVATVAYVSCHPGSFVRDARTLVDGGFDLVTVAPLDQFLWSHHLELVAYFTRR